MKPELANLFAVNNTGKDNDFILSFYYEWHEPNDGKAIETKKQKVASVVLDASDLDQLTDTLIKVREQLNGGENNEQHSS